MIKPIQLNTNFTSFKGAMNANPASQSARECYNDTLKDVKAKKDVASQAASSQSGTNFNAIA